MRGKIAVLMVTLAATTLAAQGRGGAGAGAGGGRRMQPPMRDSVRPNRAQLEQRVQQRLAQMMRTQLGLTDAQMKKVQETNRRFEEKRRVLVDQERDVRMSLRDEMARPDSARQGQVSALLDRMTKVQRQRLDILDEEQKELGAFLTPVQRAKYLGMEERVRLRMQELRQQQMGRGQMAQGRMGRGQMGMEPMDPNGPPPGGPPAAQRLRRRLPPGNPAHDSGLAG